jgi:hypothetical protein
MSEGMRIVIVADGRIAWAGVLAEPDWTDEA